MRAGGHAWFMTLMAPDRQGGSLPPDRQSASREEPGLGARSFGPAGSVLCTLLADLGWPAGGWPRECGGPREAARCPAPGRGPLLRLSPVCLWCASLSRHRGWPPRPEQAPASGAGGAPAARPLRWGPGAPAGGSCRGRCSSAGRTQRCAWGLAPEMPWDAERALAAKSAVHTAHDPATAAAERLFVAQPAQGSGVLQLQQGRAGLAVCTSQPPGHTASQSGGGPARSDLRQQGAGSKAD